jgi:hypothetical protein
MPINTNKILQNLQEQTVSTKDATTIIPDLTPDRLARYSQGVESLTQQTNEARSVVNNKLGDLQSEIEQNLAATRKSPEELLAELRASNTIQNLQAANPTAGSSAATNPNNQSLPSQVQNTTTPPSVNQPLGVITPRPYFPLQINMDRYDVFFGRKILPDQPILPVVGDRNFGTNVDPVDQFGGSGRYSENDAGFGEPPAGGTGGYTPGTGSSSGAITESYSGATRNQRPIQQIFDILDAAAAAAGVDVTIFSAGQDAKGTPNARRTGSTRHDSGRSVDVWLYDNGQRLSADRENPIIARFIAAAVNAGAKGVGAGPGYMNGVGIHIDVVGNADGGAIMWGRGCRSANTPSWVRAAYNAGKEGNIDTAIA